MNAIATKERDTWRQTGLRFAEQPRSAPDWWRVAAGSITLSLGIGASLHDFGYLKACPAEVKTWRQSWMDFGGILEAKALGLPAVRERDYVIDAFSFDGSLALLHAVQESERSYSDLCDLLGEPEWLRGLLALASARLLDVREEKVALTPAGGRVLEALSALEVA